MGVEIVLTRASDDHCGIIEFRIYPPIYSYGIVILNELACYAVTNSKKSSAKLGALEIPPPHNGTKYLCTGCDASVKLAAEKPPGINSHIPTRIAEQKVLSFDKNTYYLTFRNYIFIV